MYHEPALYGASTAELLERLHEVPDGTGSVLLIGHNPALEQLALELARPSPSRRELAVKFPTAALASLDFPGPSWRELDEAGADLIGLVRPRDLEASTHLSSSAAPERGAPGVTASVRRTSVGCASRE